MSLLYSILKPIVRKVIKGSSLHQEESYEEFKQEVADRIKEFLPEKYENADVSIQTVVKNNDQKLDGLMVKLEDSNIAPNIYLNQFYEQHEDGRPMDDILAVECRRAGN